MKKQTADETREEELKGFKQGYAKCKTDVEKMLEDVLKKNIDELSEYEKRTFRRIKWKLAKLKENFNPNETVIADKIGIDVKREF